MSSSAMVLPPHTVLTPKNTPRLLSAIPDRDFLRRMSSVLQQFITRPSVASPAPTPFDSDSTSFSMDHYIHRLLSSKLFSKECLIMALIYADRLLQNDSKFVISKRNIQRFLLVCILIASKMVDDFHCRNSLYAALGGMPSAQLSELERNLCFMLKFDLNITSTEYQLYYDSFLQVTHNPAGSPVEVPYASPAALHGAAVSHAQISALPASLDDSWHPAPRGEGGDVQAQFERLAVTPPLLPSSVPTSPTLEYSNHVAPFYSGPAWPPQQPFLPSFPAPLRQPPQPSQHQQLPQPVYFPQHVTVAQPQLLLPPQNMLVHPHFAFPAYTQPIYPTAGPGLLVPQHQLAFAPQHFPHIQQLPLHAAPLPVVFGTPASAPEVHIPSSCTFMDPFNLAPVWVRHPHLPAQPLLASS